MSMIHNFEAKFHTIFGNIKVSTDFDDVQQKNERIVKGGSYKRAKCLK